MSGQSNRVFAVLAVVTGAWLATMWGIETRWAISASAFGALWLLSEGYQYFTSECRRWIGMDGLTNRYCDLDKGHDGQCCTYDGFRKELT